MSSITPTNFRGSRKHFVNFRGSRKHFVSTLLARDGDNPGLDKLNVHIRCYAAWEFERNKVPPSQ